MKKLKKAVGILLLLAGLFVFLSPDLYGLYCHVKEQTVIRDFQEQSLAAGGDDEGSQSSEGGIQTERDTLREQIRAYNQEIFTNNQEQLCDVWSYEQNPFSVELADDLFGYIEIPAMDVTLPLYVGATTANLARGTAILGQSSLPVGDNDTNSVIVGHRGYRGAPYFRDIEKLKTGDEVRVAGPFDTLVYTVEETAVISPSDIEAILIRPGEEMITLLTCHPYMGHGKYRYVVYCSRSRDEKNQAEKTVGTERTESQGQEIQKKQPDISWENSDVSTYLIFLEKILRRAGALMIIVMLLYTIYFWTIKNRSDRI